MSICLSLHTGACEALPKGLDPASSSGVYPAPCSGQGNARDESEREYNKGHWEGEILNFRKQIHKELKASPSLKRYIKEIFDECYQDGRDIASKRSQLSIDIFPSSPIGNIEQILDENWLP